jgi:hypothetical protein
MEEALMFNEMHQQVSAVLMQHGTRIGEAISRCHCEVEGVQKGLLGKVNVSRDALSPLDPPFL